MARNISGSRPSNSSKHRKSTKSVKQSNATGFAKRQAQKAAKAAARSDDFYEYAPEKSRRAKIGLDLDREEALDAGGPSLGSYGEGQDDIEDFRMKARLIGENDDDEQIASDDDEEIDSDAAFEEEDEDRFAGFFSSKKKGLTKKKSKKSAVRFADVDLNEYDDEEVDQDEEDMDEDDEEEESGPDDEFIDVLDILDGREKPLSFSDDEEEDAKSSKHKSTLKAAMPSSPSSEDELDAADSEEEEDDDGEEDDKISISLSDAEEDATGALDELHNFISSLDKAPSGTKRKASAEDGEGNEALTQSKKRRVLKERTEAGAESEFRTKSAGLSLTDLLAPLGGSSMPGISALEKSVKALQPSSGEPSKKRPQTLSAPLPQRAQERLDREAAYEQTKEEVSKWNATMRRIQEAEHLSFPLQAQSQGRVSNLELAAKFKPTTDLEKTVSKLLASANMATDADILQTEENMLKANALSVEEVAERRRELRRMRELMFRAEVKAKRVKKIKSKVYRRMRRKEREAAGEGAEDPDEDDEERIIRMERDRARERATLKHKNTGKWAKQMKRRGGYGEDDDEGMGSGRAEIEDMLARGEKLRRRIQGKESGDEHESDEDGSDEDEDVDGAFNELQALRDAEENDEEEVADKKGKSIFEMKFMKDAMARKQQEANKMVDDFVKEMGGDIGEGSEDEDVDVVQDESGVVVSRTGGRMTFQPGANTGRLSRNGDTVSHASSSTLKSTSSTSPTVLITPETNGSSRPLLSQPQPISSSQDPSTNPNVNPWLVPSSDSQSKASRKKNEVVVAKNSSVMTKSKNKLKKEARKAAGDKAKANEDAVVEIQMDSALSLRSEESASTSNATQKAGAAKKKGKEKGKQKASASVADDAQNVGDEDSDANSEVEEQEKTLLQPKKGKKLQAIEQRELVARAFAGDNVVTAFEEAKRAEITADAPKEVDTTLPGWGSWGGVGTTQTKPKPHLIKKVAGIDPKSRADYGKGHVIISEKKDKKAAKYLIKDLPYPYTSKAQFERRMEQPLGPEWNTRVGFQKGTLPKVVKKMGKIIDPLEKLF